MTHDEWEKEWAACFARLRAKGYDLVESQTIARNITRARYGPQPGKPPVWLRVTAKIAGRKLDSLRPGEEKTMGQRILAAVVFGFTAVLSALGASGIPQTQQGWLGLLGVFMTAFWGKFSSNQTLLAPNREVWSVDQRDAAKK